MLLAIMLDIAMRGLFFKILILGSVFEFFKTEAGMQLQDEVASTMGILNDPTTMQKIIQQTSREESSLDMAARQFKNVPTISTLDAINEISKKR